MTADWIWLRGLMREQGHWEDFPARFRQRFPQSRLYLADLPGFGQAVAQTSPATIAATTDWLRRQWSRPRPVRLLGLSLGAMVATDWACRYPHEVAGLVLLNASFAGLSPWHQRLRPTAWAPLLRWLLWQRDPRVQESTILSLTSQYHATDADIIARWADIAAAQPPRRSNTLRQLLAALRYRLPAKPPGCPLLILNGGADRLVHPACSQALAEYWGRPLYRCAGAGHDLSLDAPDWVLQRIAEAFED